MLPLENTYTFTARSANDPRKVVTFTLHENSLSIDVAALAEQIERALAPQTELEDVEAGEPEKVEKIEVDEFASQARPWLTPGAVSLLQRATEPFHISDVDAESPDGGLRVTAWVRANDLRLAPVLFRMQAVDNPRAADDFVNEIKRRKESVPPVKRFPGPFDYWASWALGGAMAVGALAAWLLPRRGKDEEASQDEIG
jgi:hypothetical protein